MTPKVKRPKTAKAEARKRWKLTVMASFHNAETRSDARRLLAGMIEAGRYDFERTGVAPGIKSARVTNADIP